MQKLLAFFALAAAGTACQQAQTTIPAAQAATVGKPADHPAVVLGAKARTLLGRYDLSELLTIDEVNPRPENGFFGPDHYRLEMAFLSAERDAGQPNVYQVTGKSRYKKVITPFTGTITLTSAADQPPYTAQDIAEAKKNFGADYHPGKLSEYDPPYMYAAAGTFELREDPAAKGAGVFRGKVALDWGVTKEGKTTLAVRSARASQTQGGLIRYYGTWTNNTTRQTFDAEWVQSIESYRRAEVLNVFEFGGRDVDITPKYAKRGWNTYWENTEWWLDSPQPTAAL